MTISLSQAAHFWQVVTQCPVEVYGVSPVKAQFQTTRLFRETAAMSAGLEPQEEWLSEMIYHAEPIVLASTLAGKPIPEEEHLRSLYREISLRPLETTYGEKERPEGHVHLQAAGAMGAPTETLLRSR